MEAPATIEPTERLAPEAFAERAQAIEREVGRVIVGQRELVRQTLTGLLANSHVLLEGVPGLGKTLLVRALSHVLGASFKRIQFTPDLLPSDVTGGNNFNVKDAQFLFVPGPVFTQLLLGDEINRAPAKTQSALLEAMQDRSVTADGVT
ncbi:MAG: AAA family ATPase, partial [Candidatus Limnocylindria bacterium]